MEWSCTLSFSGRELPIILSAERVGEDWLLCLQGGDVSHIGTVVAASPRPSLAGGGRGSCTSSVINFPNHLDEAPCRKIAESFSRTFGRPAVCAGGIHIDGATPECIRAVLDACAGLCRRALAELCPGTRE